MEKLTAIVEKICYSHTNNWRILSTDKGTIKGVIAWDVKEKDRIEINGEWKRSPRDGRMEFEFKSAIPSIPDDSRALLQYAAEKTTGIGEAKEELIWQAFGEDWRNHPDLEGIPGIRANTKFAWKTTLKEIEIFGVQAKTIAHLLACGCTINMASIAWEQWEASTLGKVQENPYELAQLPHYGFTHVDAIRMGFGIADNDPRRMREAIIYAIKQQGDVGHTVVNISEAANRVKELVPYEDQRYDEAIKALVQLDRIKLIQDGDVMFVALKENYEYEEAVYERYS